MSDSPFQKQRAAFRALHESGCFVIPNPWDVGSARYLRHLGFSALATTSAGLAFSQGMRDSTGAVPIETVLANTGEIVAAVDLPVNADFGSGFADAPSAMAKNVLRCVATGVAGLSIEDATGDREKPLYELPLAVERIQAARAAIDETKTGVLLTARAESFLVGHPEPFRESVRRLRAYAEAGADVLYAPGIDRHDDIKNLLAEVGPKPVNILVGRNIGLTVADLAALGVRRISVGSALARAAWTGFMAAAEAIATDGSFAGFEGARSFRELDQFFAKPGNLR